MIVNRTVIKEFSYGSILDITTDTGCTSFLTLDRRGYHLSDERYGSGGCAPGYTWPTRKAALATAYLRTGVLNARGTELPRRVAKDR